MKLQKKGKNDTGTLSTPLPLSPIFFDNTTSFSLKTPSCVALDLLQTHASPFVRIFRLWETLHQAESSKPPSLTLLRRPTYGIASGFHVVFRNARSGRRKGKVDPPKEELKEMKLKEWRQTETHFDQKYYRGHARMNKPSPRRCTSPPDDV